MRKYWRELAATVVILGVVGPALWLSPTFENCIHAIPSNAPGQHQDYSLAFFLFFGGRWFGCLGPFVDINSAAIVAVFTIVLAFSTILLWLHTKRLAEGADAQADQMTSSIAEAAKSAVAMQGVADAMATNVDRLKDSLVIQREMVDRQKLVTELQSRAYMSVVFYGMVKQDPTTKIRFEPRVKIVNLGNTPAYNIKFATAADVLRFPIPDDFTFPLGPKAGRSSFIGPRLDKILSAVVPKIYQDVEAQQIKEGAGQRIAMWGHITYDDAFGTERYVKFALTFYYLNDGETVMSADEARHNDAD